MIIKVMVKMKNVAENSISTQEAAQASESTYPVGQCLVCEIINLKAPRPGVWGFFIT
jgi:hypothetical protein